MTRGPSAMVLAAGIVTLSVISGAAAPLEPHVTVRLYRADSARAADLAGASSSAGLILRQAGVQVAWIDCAAEAGRGACARVMGPADLAVRVVLAGVPTGREALPLGNAFVDLRARAGSLATLYLDRVRWLAASSGTDERLLLGRAMAHEVGHLLLGTSRHAKTGLMRARWSYEDVRRGIATDWRFSRDESARLRAATATRTALQPTVRASPVSSEDPNKREHSVSREGGDADEQHQP